MLGRPAAGQWWGPSEGGGRVGRARGEGHEQPHLVRAWDPRRQRLPEPEKRKGLQTSVCPFFFFFLNGMWDGRCVTHLLCPKARDPQLLRTLGVVAGPRSSRLTKVSQLDKSVRLSEGLKWGRGRCPLFPWSSRARVPEGLLSPSWASLHPTPSCVIHHVSPPIRKLPAHSTGTIRVCGLCSGTWASTAISRLGQ